MRRKEYAVSLGLATPGKGRMSREALAAIDKARAGGMTFDDDAPTPVKTPKTVTVTEKRPVAVRREPVESNNIMGDVMLAYPLDQTFTGYDDGKKVTVNSAAVCRNTGYSICGCHCGPVHSVLSPRSLTHIDVR